MAMREVNPTFIIGLGGIGNKVLRLVRERFIATSDTGTLFPTVLLRSIDTTNQAPSWAEPLPDKMFTNVGGFNADEVVDHLDSYPEIKRWYKYGKGEFAPGFVSSGAKAKRPVGRICFYQRFQRIKSSLEGDFQIPKSNDLREQLLREMDVDISLVPHVYLVGSVAGGTCSGMFIDTAFAVRQMLNSLGYHGIQIVGLFALPSVIHADSGDADTDVGTQRKINSIGALHELDFLMQSWERDAFELEYPQIGRFRPMAPLFNQVFLLGSTKEDGVRFESGKDIMIRQAHFLYSLASAGIGGDVSDVMVNVPEKIDPSQRKLGDGQLGVYCTFGTEWLEIPMDELVSHYSELAGPQLSKLLTEPVGLPGKKEMRQDFLGRLPREYDGLGKGLDLLRKPKESLPTMRGLEDLAGLLQSIQTAEKKSEVKDSLNDFLSALSGAMANVRRSLSIRSDFELEESNIKKMKHDWIENPQIGIIGASQYLFQAAELLGQLDVEIRPIQQDISDVVDMCGRGMLKKCDPTPAYEYALDRLKNEVSSTVRGELADLASRLMVKIKKEANLLQNLGETLRIKMGNLSLKRSTQEEIPREMWKIDPNDLESVITGSTDDLLVEVARSIQTRVVDQLLTADNGWELWKQDEVEDYLNQVALDSIRYAASKRIAPPNDLVDRLRRRMSACYPMADTERSGSHLFRQFFGTDEAGAPTSIQIVSSNVEGSTREQLNEWAANEKTRANSNHAFQTVPSGDPSRDDLINISLGWPLWLVREIRTDWEKVDGIRTSRPGRYQYSLIMNEIPGAGTHSINPMDPEEMKGLFGIGLVLGHIKIVGSLDGIDFDPEAFGSNFEGVANKDSNLNMFIDAKKRFDEGGLARNYSGFLGDKQSTGDGILELRKDLLEGLEKRRTMLENAKTQLNPELVSILSEYYDRADKFAQTLVVL